LNSEQASTAAGGKGTLPKGARVGVVDSISGRKTVRVVLSNLVPDRLYGKYVRRRRRLLAHDPREQARLGDEVQIAPCRPISKNKAWRVVRVVKRSAQA